MHCNGKCYLSKQLKKAEEGEQKQSQKILKEKEEVISNNHEVLTVGFSPQVTLIMYSLFLSAPPVSDYRNDLVKPPAA